MTIKGINRGDKSKIFRIHEVRASLSTNKKLWSVITVVLEDTRGDLAYLEGVLASPVSRMPRIISMLNTKIFASPMEIFNKDYKSWDRVSAFIRKAHNRWLTKSR